MVFLYFFFFEIQSIAPSQTAQSQQQMPQIMNKVVSNVHTSAIKTDAVANSNQSSTAPPLPPRGGKSSPNVADNSAVNRMLKPQTASSLMNLSNNTNLSAILSKSFENITTCELEVPKSNAPPVPKHNSIRTNIDDIDDELKHIHLANMDDACDKVIVGPAETIM